MDDFDIRDFPKKVPSLKHNYETITLKDAAIVVYTKETVAAKTSHIAAEAAALTSLDVAKKSLNDDDKIIEAQSFYQRFVSKSMALCAIEAAAPQRSKLWHDARRFCITASNFAAAVGNNKYCSPNEFLIDKLWASFKGSEATRYGTFHEQDAQDSLKAILPEFIQDLYFEDATCDGKFTLLEFGLLKHTLQPWMAVSPDGILVLNGTKGPRYILIEYKCPANLRDSQGHPYSKSPFNVPEYYMDQIQGIMGLLNKFPDLLVAAKPPVGIIDYCLFVVWQPLQLHITRIPYKRKYYEDFLEPALKDFYFEKYLPFAVLKHNGQLKKNSLDYEIHI